MKRDIAARNIGRALSAPSRTLASGRARAPTHRRHAKPNETRRNASGTVAIRAPSGPQGNTYDLWGLGNVAKYLKNMARPERFELPTPRMRDHRDRTLSASCPDDPCGSTRYVRFRQHTICPVIFGPFGVWDAPDISCATDSQNPIRNPVWRPVHTRLINRPLHEIPDKPAQIGHGLALDQAGDETKTLFHYRTLFPRHHALRQNGEKRYPCVRYETPPMSRVAHCGEQKKQRQRRGRESGRNLASGGLVAAIGLQASVTIRC